MANQAELICRDTEVYQRTTGLYVSPHTLREGCLWTGRPGGSVFTERLQVLAGDRLCCRPRVSLRIVAPTLSEVERHSGLPACLKDNILIEKVI